MNKNFIVPDLAEYVRQMKLEVKRSINSSEPGRIESFDADTQTATVSLFIKRRQVGAVAPSGNNPGDRTTADIVLVNVPVIVLSGGYSKLTFPILSGDECLVIFSDRDIDNWFETGSAALPNSDRLHSLNDGFALVGIRSKLTQFSGYNQDGPELSNGDIKISLEDKVKITNGVNTLKTVLDGLCDALISSVQTDGSAFNPATLTALGNVKTTISELLK